MWFFINSYKPGQFWEDAFIWKLVKCDRRIFCLHDIFIFCIKLQNKNLLISIIEISLMVYPKEWLTTALIWGQHLLITSLSKMRQLIEWILDASFYNDLWFHHYDFKFDIVCCQALLGAATIFGKYLFGRRFEI